MGFLYDNPDYSDSQNSSEFLDAWKYIHEKISSIEKKEITFLEIGADKGLWSIMFFAVCKSLGKIPAYTTATLIEDDNQHYQNMGFSMDNFLNYSYRNKNIYKVQDFYSQFGYEYNIINGNSQEDATRSKVESFHNDYDIVFIDGDHTYNGVMKDIEFYAPMCKGLLIFHDILPRERKLHYIQVYPAIVDSNISLDVEFIHDGNLMGIGIKNLL